MSDWKPGDDINAACEHSLSVGHDVCAVCWRDRAMALDAALADTQALKLAATTTSKHWKQRAETGEDKLAEAKRRANELDKQLQGVWVLFAKAERRTEEAEQRATTAEERARDHHLDLGSCITCMHAESERDEARKECNREGILAHHRGEEIDELEAHNTELVSELRAAHGKADADWDELEAKNAELEEERKGLARNIVELAAQHAKLRAVLESVEWAALGALELCPSCRMSKASGHQDNCDVKRALASDGSAATVKPHPWKPFTVRDGSKACSHCHATEFDPVHMDSVVSDIPDGSAVAPDLLERLADREHERWSRWMRYLFSCGASKADGSFRLNESTVERWKRQMNTPYSQLTEAEKESDRKEAREILETLGRSDGSAVACDCPGAGHDPRVCAATRSRRLSSAVAKVMELVDRIVADKEPWSYQELVQAVRHMREKRGDAEVKHDCGPWCPDREGHSSDQV